MSTDRKLGQNNLNLTNQKNEKEKQTTHGNSSSKDWNDSEVKLLKKWGELSASYRVLHDKAHRYYKFRNYLFTIPVIIFSTILGTASFSQDTFPEPYSSYMPMGIGTLNIISGIITTIAQFTRVSELSEANRVASISYGKFSRNIATELSLPPEFRSYTGIDFVQICRSEFDRLVEQSPTIPLEILNQFMQELEDENIQIEQPDVMKVSPIEVWQPTKEEKAAKIIANAFQTMHNRNQELKKSGVQKMADLVERKGLSTINKITNNLPSPKQIKDTFISNKNNFMNQKNDIENQIETQKNNIVDNTKQKIGGLLEKQIESRQNELNSMTKNNIVGRIMQNSPFGSMKSFKKDTSNSPNIISNIKNNIQNDIENTVYDALETQSDISSVSNITNDNKKEENIKPNIKNMIEKAKKNLNNNIEEVKDNIGQLKDNIELVKSEIQSEINPIIKDSDENV